TNAGYYVSRPTSQVPYPTPSTAPNGSCLLPDTSVLAIVSGAPIDQKIGSWDFHYTMVVQGQLTDDQKKYLSHASAILDTVDIVASAGLISADVEKQIGDLIAGPAGYASATNPAP